MRSMWIEHHGKKTFSQDFSKHFFNSAAVRAELGEVQTVVTAESKESVLVLSDFRGTNVSSDLLASMHETTAATKAHVHKTEVPGVTGMKRKCRSSYNAGRSAAQVF